MTEEQKKEKNSNQTDKVFKKNTRKPNSSREVKERVKPEFDQKIVSIRRVTRVVTGGRRFSFAAAVVVGDRNGRVGLGTGKGNDTPVAIDKAVRQAKKHLVRVSLDSKKSIPHETDAKYSSSRVLIFRAPGKGILAGSSVRSVLELAGINDVGAKLLSRTKNQINNAGAAIKALSKIRNIK
jgi:small subunit ribosomal protein S5